MSEPMKLEDRDGVTVARMEFGRGNALGPDVVEEIAAGLDRSGDGPLVLTGSGRIFSAGLDLVTLQDRDRESMEIFLERFSSLMLQVLTARRPIVAAVNGHAVAGGCVLAMACDHRVGVDGDFKIGMNELAIGLTLPAVVTEIMRHELTPPVFRRVVLRGELVDPRRARALGLLDDLADEADAAEHRAVEIARNLGASPPAYRVMKGSLVSPVAERLQTTREPLDHAFLESWFSPASRRARAAAIARLTDKGNDGE